VRALVVNVGSSTTKVAAYEEGAEGGPTELTRATFSEGSPDALAAALEEWWGTLHPAPPDVVGHRLVHGGTRFREPVQVDGTVRAALDDLVALAPLHLPGALAALDALARRWPGAGVVACFDTAFHATLPRVAYELPLPPSVRSNGVRKYGFHGLSCEHVVDVLGGRYRRAVVAHLGAGCSVTGVLDGASVDTTMGMTPDGGIPMATRSGDLDPGALLHLLDSGIGAAELRDIVEHRSGLSGWAGEADMQRLLERGDADGRFAVEAFCAHVAKAVAACAVSTGGLDVLVFTGDIGEHSAVVRDAVAARLAHLPAFVVEVVPADEEAVIARSCFALRSEQR